MILLGVLTTINGLLGILIVDIPFLVIALIDGSLKIVIGIKLLFNRQRPLGVEINNNHLTEI